MVDFVESARADFDDFADFDGIDRSKDFGNQRQQEKHTGVSSPDDHSSDADLREILLIRQAAVGGNDHSHTSSHGGTEQDAISQAAPAVVANGRDVVPGQFLRELNRQRLVDQNLQAQSPRRTRSGSPRLLARAPL